MAHRRALARDELLRKLGEIAKLEGQLAAHFDISLDDLRICLYKEYPTPDERLDLLLRLAAYVADKEAEAQPI